MKHRHSERAPRLQQQHKLCGKTRGKTVPCLSTTASSVSSPGSESITTARVPVSGVVTSTARTPANPTIQTSPRITVTKITKKCVVCIVEWLHQRKDNITSVCRHVCGCYIPLKQSQGWGPTSTPLGITVIPRGGVLQTSVMTRGGPLPPPTPGHHRLY